MRHRNSGDELRRRHEREGDRIRVLIDRHRRGDLEPFYLKAAAWFGHEDAVEAARRLGVRFLSPSSEPDEEINWGRDDDTKARRQGWVFSDIGDGYRIKSTDDTGTEVDETLADDKARERVRRRAFKGDKLAIKALILLRGLARSNDYDVFAYGREYAQTLDPEQIIVRRGRVYRRLADFPSGPSLEEITDNEAIRIVRPVEQALVESFLTAGREPRRRR